MRKLKDFHSLDLVHRDLKPANICLNEQNDILFIDFGLTRRFKLKDFIEYDKEVDYRYLIGTLNYASVNSHEEKNLGRRDDVISLTYSFIDLIYEKLP